MEDRTRANLETYIDNLMLYVNFTHLDSSSPLCNEKLMRSIECGIGISEQEVDGFRHQIALLIRQLEITEIAQLV